MTLHIHLTGRVIVKKNSQRIVRSPKGRPFTIPSIAYEKFKNAARADVLSHFPGITFRNPVRIDYTFFMKGRLDADLDNVIASINDVLKDSRILEDDALVTEITARKIPWCRDFETDITIVGDM